MADQADRLRALRLVRGSADATKASRSWGASLGRPVVRSIAVVSGKGGVGKTAVASNLALALRRRGQRVLLVDGDLALSNVDLVHGLTPKFTLGDVVLGRVPIEDVVLTTSDGVRILPACSGIEEIADLDDFRRETLLRQLTRLEDNLDVIVIDVGSGIGRQAMHFARAAGQALVVTTPEPTAFADAYAVIKLLSSNRRTAPASLGLVVNMARSPREGRETARRIRAVAARFLGLEPECYGVVPFDDAVARSVRRQELLLRLFPHSPAATSVDLLAARLLVEIPEPEPESIAPDLLDDDTADAVESNGFFQKIAGGGRR